jgi:hypothetical protein
MILAMCRIQTDVAPTEEEIKEKARIGSASVVRQGTLSHYHCLSLAFLQKPISTVYDGDCVTGLV